MVNTTLQTPYASAMPYVAGKLNSWMSEYDAQRTAAYDLYDDLYHSAPNTVSLLLRGNDTRPIYIPSSKRLINTLARYVGRGWGVVVDPKVGSATEREACEDAFSALFRRERILTQFAMGKKEWLRRGDWVWYVSGNPNKPAGSRLTIKSIDPRNYFKLLDEDDPDKVIGAMLVEEDLEDDGTTFVLRRQRWLKPSHPDYPYELPVGEDGEPTLDEPLEIAYDSVILDMEDWEDPRKQKIKRTLVPMELIPGITSLPLYQISNNEQSQNPYGLSDLAGLESVAAAINQSATDEDIALAISGLGLFVTDGGAPVDENKKRTPWKIGPRRVIEVGAGKKFERIAGVTSVAPMQDHIKFLENNFYGLSGVNDIALGKNSASAKSGIALAIEMQPLFDTADEKDLALNDVMTQMMHDLATQWFPQYEDLDFSTLSVYTDTDRGDRLPFDREARFTELTAMLDAGTITVDFFLAEMTTKFGYTFPAGMAAKAKAESAEKIAASDPFGARGNEEKNDIEQDNKPDDEVE